MHRCTHSSYPDHVFMCSGRCADEQRGNDTRAKEVQPQQPNEILIVAWRYTRQRRDRLCTFSQSNSITVTSRSSTADSSYKSNSHSDYRRRCWWGTGVPTSGTQVASLAPAWRGLLFQCLTILATFTRLHRRDDGSGFRDLAVESGELVVGSELPSSSCFRPAAAPAPPYPAHA